MFLLGNEVATVHICRKFYIKYQILENHYLKHISEFKFESSHQAYLHLYETLRVFFNFYFRHFINITYNCIYIFLKLSRFSNFNEFYKKNQQFFQLKLFYYFRFIQSLITLMFSWFFATVIFVYWTRWICYLNLILYSFA